MIPTFIGGIACIAASLITTKDKSSSKITLPNLISLILKSCNGTFLIHTIANNTNVYSLYNSKMQRLSSLKRQLPLKR